MAARIRPKLLLWQAFQAPCRQRVAPLTLHIQLPKSFSQQAPLRTTPTISVSTTPESSQIPASQESNVENQSTPAFEPLSYFVHRTPSQQLPIYHLAKAGGNKHQTRIRKITGSVEDLRDDLKEALGLGEKEIAINSINGHIVIKGWKKFEVAAFLEGKHF